MDVHGKEDKADIYADMFCLNCDTPALHKLGGVAGHPHDIHPCPHCDTILLNVNQQAGYDNSTCCNSY